MGWQGLHPPAMCWPYRAHILQTSPLQTGGETPLGSGGRLGTLGCCVPAAEGTQRQGWRPGCEVSRASAAPQLGPPFFRASCRKSHHPARCNPRPGQQPLLGHVPAWERISATPLRTARSPHRHAGRVAPACWAGDVDFRGRMGIRDAEHTAGVQLGFSEGS